MYKRFIFFYLILSFFEVYSEVYYIKPRYYLDVISGEMISGKIIGIDNGIIKSISSQVPLSKTVQEFKDLFLLPGLIDCHAHIFFTQTVEDQGFEKALLREVEISAKDRLIRARVFLKQYLAEGFTSVCDLGNSGNFLDMKLRNEILYNSSYPGLFISGPGIAVKNAQFNPQTKESLIRKEYLIVNEKSDIEAILKNYLDKKIDILKVYLDNSPGLGGMNPEILSKIINSSKVKKFKKLTFHSIESRSLKELLALPQINIEHGSSLDFHDFKGADRLSLTPTLLPAETLKDFQYYNNAFYEFQIAKLKEAYKEKVLLVFGPDFYFHKNKAGFNRAKIVKKSIEVWKKAQISPIDIIRAMTINASKSLNENMNLGVIQVGANANLIGVRENPLEKIEALNTIHLLINKGKILKYPGPHTL